MNKDNDVPWIEKYNPKKLSDIYGNSNIIERLENMLSNNNLSNLIISGPSGTGKSCSINCLVKHALGDSISDGLLLLNGSDDRGINVIRVLIKSFAQKKLLLDEGKYKIIILDEADSITVGSQQALRRIIENYSKTTRFIFICNHLNKIIEPIQSRCTMLEFEKLHQKDLYQMLEKICQFENIKYTINGLELISKISYGDMRQAIGNLQNTYYCSHVINKKSIFEICNIPLHFLLKNFVKLCLKNEFREVCKILKETLNNGYSTDDIIHTMFYLVRTNIMITEIKRIEFIKEISVSGININDGVEGIIPIYSVASRLCTINQK